MYAMTTQTDTRTAPRAAEADRSTTLRPTLRLLEGGAQASRILGPTRFTSPSEADPKADGE